MENLPKIDSIDWENYPYVHHAVVTFIRQKGATPAENKILLIIKKRGMGKGKVNGPGGKMEKGETPLDTAIRETQEEVGLTPTGLKHHCDLHFLFKDGYSMRGHIFLADGYEGKLIETDEADPFWCLESEIPYKKMWEDDQLWLPHILEGKTANGYFTFDDDKIIEKKVIVQ